MKYFIRNLVWMLLIGLLLAYPAFSGTPGYISYQGILKDSADVPITGIINLTFAIYDDSTAVAPSNLKWQETHLNVNVDKGLFRAILGAGSPPVAISDTIFSGSNRWLSIRIQGGAEQQPRTRMISVPYSQRIQTIDGATGGSISGAVSINGVAKSTVSGVDFFMVPRGAIIMWSGLLANIPSGWALCDGSIGTPDLRNRFIYGCDTGQNPGNTGGIASHNHLVDIDGFEASASGWSWYGAVTLGGSSLVNDYRHTHTVDPPATYSGSADNLPPYYKLAFIMKL